MQDKANKLYNIDNIEFLRTLPDNSVSSLISDVPYALCDIDALKMIKEDMQIIREILWGVLGFCQLLTSSKNATVF
jgi:DNA modification methylase